MAFPNAPADGQQHSEGSKNYVYHAANGIWLVEDTGGAGATNLTVANRTATTLDINSDTGADATVPAASTTEAGLLTAADKTKLDGVEAGAAADQTAAEVSFSNGASGLAATNLQAAVDEIVAAFAGLGDVIGNYVGQAATSAALDALVDPNDGAAPDNGDWAILTADEGGKEAGIYVRAGGAWPASPVWQFPDAFTSADATLLPALLGAGGVATTYARSDHRHAQSRGAVLPAIDGTGGAEHILIGHANLPDGKYVLLQDDAGTPNNVWVQV